MIIHENLIYLRHEQMLAEAKRIHLAARADRRPIRINQFYGPILNRLGSLLSRWGGNLQDRFGDPDIVNPSQSMDRGIHVLYDCYFS